MKRMKELILQYRDEYGIYEAKKMAKKERLSEMIEELCMDEMTTDEKVDKIITVLELMNMKVDQ